jgi:hypothetical protein
MNDIILPWKKIVKGLPSPKQAAEDHVDSRREIPNTELACILL